jgi:hypothetical protein
MRLRAALRPAVLLLIPALASGVLFARPQSGAPRIVAVGDIHGSLDGLRTILGAAGLIDARGRWSGGRAHLVQTGDYTDRGAQVRAVIDLLMRLEDEAKRAGGRVDVLMGNHEAMNLLHDFRDASPEAFATFADARSEDRLQRAWREYADVMKRGGRPAVPLEDWRKNHPPGFVEYVEALSPRGRYGRWLRARKIVVEDNGTIFMHGGLPEDTNQSLDDINRTAAAEIKAWDDTREMLVEASLIRPFFTLRETLDVIVAELKRISTAIDTNAPLGAHVTREFAEALQSGARIGESSLVRENGPLWFRGFAQWTNGDEAKLDALLQRFKVKRFVTGHTPMVKGITSRFDNRLFFIDTGMLGGNHYPGGRPSAIEIDGDTITAVYADGRQVLK